MRRVDNPEWERENLMLNNTESFRAVATAWYAGQLTLLEMQRRILQLVRDERLC